jgi:excisionase family DNA binding protein
MPIIEGGAVGTARGVGKAHGSRCSSSQARRYAREVSLVSDPLLTREEAAEYLNVKPQTLAVWATTGRYSLPMVRVGRRVRYRQSDLDRWIAKRTIMQSNALEE